MHIHQTTWLNTFVFNKPKEDVKNVQTKPVCVLHGASIHFTWMHEWVTGSSIVEDEKMDAIDSELIGQIHSMAENAVRPWWDKVEYICFAIRSIWSK